MNKALLTDLHLFLQDNKIQYKGYNLIFLSQIFIADYYFGFFKSFSATSLIKKFSLENIVKLLYYLFRKKSKVSVEPFTFLFVNEVKNKAMIETLEKVYEKFDPREVAIVNSDYRLCKEGAKNLSIFSSLNLIVFIHIVIDIILINFKLVMYFQEVRKVWRRYDINPFLLIFNIYDSIFIINIIKQFLNKYSFDKVVLNSDVHKISRVITIESGLRGIPSFVLQHGSVIGEEGYLPISATKFLAWGDYSKKWFNERGNFNDKIISVGSPRMDATFFKENNFANNKIQNLLVVMSDGLREYEFIRIIRDAIKLAGLNNIKLTIKLHPASVDHDHIPKKALKDFDKEYHIIKAANINELLEQSDVVFVTASTVGMEAIIHGKPLVEVKLKENDVYNMTYSQYDCSIQVREENELVPYLKNATLLKSKLYKYPKLIEDCFFKLDGQSSERAKNYIKNFQG